MSHTKATITFPATVMDEITTMATSMMQDAAHRLLTDATNPSGHFTTHTSGIQLDFNKSVAGAGHVARQLLDCSLIDSLATSLRKEGVNTGMTKEEHKALIDRGLKSLGQLNKAGPTGDDTVSYTDIKKIVDGYARSLATGSEESGFRVSPKVAFLRLYDAGFEKADEGVRSYISNLTGVEDEEKRKMLSHLSQPTSYYDHIMAASETIGDEHAVGWETARQIYMQSGGARGSFWSKEMKEVREDLMSRLGVSVGPWPDLPEPLRVWAKQQTKRICSRTSDDEPETDETGSRKRRRT